MAHFRLLAITLGLATALHAAPADDVLPIGADVKAPRLVHKVDPVYALLARTEHIQGVVILELVVDEKGLPRHITVNRPLGYGLDEQAVAAVEKWEFAPGTKDGKPVSVFSIVEVNFKLIGLKVNKKARARRAAFDTALQTLNRVPSTATDTDHAIAVVKDLAKRDFPPAMRVAGLWEMMGEHVAKDSEDGLLLLEKAAAKNDGTALYEIAIRRIEGRGLSKDLETGLEEMRRSALLGSTQAQFYLADRFDTGNGVPREPNRASWYFRLCAYQGRADCQYRLGKLLYDASFLPERNHLKAIALFQLAGEQGIQDAKDIASRESTKLTPAQKTVMENFKTMLVSK